MKVAKNVRGLFYCIHLFFWADCRAVRCGDLWWLNHHRSPMKIFNWYFCQIFSAFVWPVIFFLWGRLSAPPWTPRTTFRVFFEEFVFTCFFSFLFFLTSSRNFHGHSGGLATQCVELEITRVQDITVVGTKAWHSWVTGGFTTAFRWAWGPSASYAVTNKTFPRV